MPFNKQSINGCNGGFASSIRFEVDVLFILFYSVSFVRLIAARNEVDTCHIHHQVHMLQHWSDTFSKLHRKFRIKTLIKQK